MAEEERQEVPHFYQVVCPQCGGGANLPIAEEATVGEQGCPLCQNQGLVYWYTNLDPQQPEEYTLYWGKKVDWSHIAQRHLENTITKVINGLLIIFGLVGLLFGFWFYGLPLIEGQVLIFTFSPLAAHFKGWPQGGIDWRVILFWFSLLTDLYIYYRLERVSAKKELVIKKIFQEGAVEEKDFTPPQVPNWAELNRPEVEKIDISLGYTEDALKSLEQAWRIAKNWRHTEVLPIHLLAGLFGSKKLNIIFSRLGADWEKLIKGVKGALAKLPRGESEPVLSLPLKNILFIAYQQAYLGRQPKVTTAELLIALDLEENLASRLFYDLEIEVDKIRNVVVWLQINEKMRQQWQRYHRLGKRRPKGEVNKAYTAVMTPFLDAFSTDLTRQAAYGLFLPNVGREKEIEEIFRIIQGSSESVVLVGFPGVGKTAVIEEISQRMIADDVPKIMQDKRLVALSVAKVTAGATPSEANERLLRIFNEIVKAGNIILIIENIHDLVGISTGGEESLDLSEALANYLAKTNSIAISTTTPQDYNFLETSTSLGNYLHRVNIKEPQGNVAIQILESRVGMIEGKNKVYFSYDAIAQAVELASRYLHERYLPSKAIDILQEVAVYVAKNKGENTIINAEDIATIVSQKTNIPLTKITEEESEKLVGLEREIHQRMVDQEEPVKEVAAALRRARAGMRDSKRPIANFLFLGPTGVGKTELAKTIGAVYFGSEENMIRLDMSEYQTKESLYRLIGAPTGETKGGYLTQAVRRNPFSLLLFDEVEKAHPDILNLFLQVMDDGRLTDNAGRTIDFSNSIIIMTSNAGTRYIQEQVKAGIALEDIKNELIENQLAKFFRPEFLNRFDSIDVFKPLTMVEVVQIANLMIKKSANNLIKEGVVLEITPAAIEELAEAGFDPQFGARPLRRVIQERISNVLANLKIQSQFKRGDKVVFDVGGKVRVEKGD